MSGVRVDAPTTEYLLGMIEGMRTVRDERERARRRVPPSDSPAGRAYRLGRRHGALTALCGVVGLGLAALVLRRPGGAS